METLYGVCSFQRSKGVESWPVNVLMHQIYLPSLSERQDGNNTPSTTIEIACQEVEIVCFVRSRAVDVIQGVRKGGPGDFLPYRHMVIRDTSHSH